MTTDLIILSMVLIPVFGAVLSLLVPERSEILISDIAFYTVCAQLLSAFSFSIYWIINGGISFNLKEFTLYDSGSYTFLIDFYFDIVTLTFLLVGSFITFLIVRYSRYYMHLESGYKRFFNVILLFFAGYNLTVLSGNFETLFIGWEILGISSFLLIAFYRERYLPVRNAVKVFSIYRIGDVGVLLAMWASHHLWHENITFSKLNNYELVHTYLEGHSAIGIFVSICLLGAAAAKSAQLPFSSWLPRAMEGPTPSSAIFYGSLSVHLGLFLLLRTYPFWEHQIIVRVLIGAIGMITAIVSISIARVQYTIKTQIAYASISQIGIMLVELSLGLDRLVLLHFAGNAFLRTYQLLVSPSVVSYVIRDQLYHFSPEKKNHPGGWRGKLEATIFLLSLKEWNLDRFMSKVVFAPMKWLGKKLNFITLANSYLYFTPLLVSGVLLLSFKDHIPSLLLKYLPEWYALSGLLMVFKSFSERKSPILAVLFVVMSHICISLAVSFNEAFDIADIELYLAGILLGGIAAYIILLVLKKSEAGYFNLNQYYGHSHEYPKLTFLFLLSCLALMGFPITTSFIGLDLIFSHIHEDQFFLAFFNSLAYVLGGIALVRVYARLFLGPHVKTYHEIPLKSS